MQELIPSWTTEEESNVEHELEKLFILQDRALTQEKKAVMVQELMISGLPSSAILGGIKKLQAEDLKTVKYHTIISAASELIDQPTSNEIEKCEHCRTTGIVLMRDELNQEFCLACICRNGNNRIGLTKWNGDREQYCKLEYIVPGKGLITEERTLTLRWDTLGGN